MNNVLAAKRGAFLWNFSAFEYNAQAVADVLQLAGMASVAIKTADGRSWYDQRYSFRQIRSRLIRSGVPLVGSWTYHYFDEPAGELDKVLESIRYGRSDFHILNIEDPAIEGNRATPQIAERMFGEIRDRHPDYPLYFCSHAQPAYHERQPYWQAAQNDIAMMPMAYYTAMEVSPEDSVRLARNGLRDYELDTVPWVAAGALYGVPLNPITPSGVIRWAAAARQAGSSGLYYWSLDIAQSDTALLEAVAATPVS